MSIFLTFVGGCGDRNDVVLGTPSSGAMLGCVFSDGPNLESALVIDEDTDTEDESLRESDLKDMERD